MRKTLILQATSNGEVDSTLKAPIAVRSLFPTDPGSSRCALTYGLPSSEGNSEPFASYDDPMSRWLTAMVPSGILFPILP